MFDIFGDKEFYTLLNLKKTALKNNNITTQIAQQRLKKHLHIF